MIIWALLQARSASIHACKDTINKPVFLGIDECGCPASEFYFC